MASSLLAIGVVSGPNASARVTLHEGPVSAVFAPPDFSLDPPDGPSRICPDRIRGRVGNPRGPMVLYRPDLTRLPPGTPLDRNDEGELVYPPGVGEVVETVPVVMTIPLGPSTVPPTGTDSDPLWDGFLVRESAPFDAELPPDVAPGQTLWLLPTFGGYEHPIEVIPCTPPVAAPQSVVAGFETPIPVSLTGTDGEGDPLTFAVVDAPAHGTLSGTSPNLTYTPDPGFSGRDSFTFVADDGQYTSAPAAVTIDVGAAPSNLDVVTVNVTGGFTYSASGALSRPVAVERSDGAIVRIAASGRIAGSSKGAGIRVDLKRVLFLNVGVVTVHEPNAGIGQLGALVVFGGPVPEGPVTLSGVGVRVVGFRVIPYRIGLTIDLAD